MNNGGTSASSAPSIRKWVIAGIVCLLLLAASTGIDASFVYIFLGAAAFCFFMALRGWLSTQPWKNKNTEYQQQRQRPQQDFSFDSTFGKTSDTEQQQRNPPPGQQQQPFGTPESKVAIKRVFTVVATIFVGIFSLIIFVGIFGEDDHESEVQHYNAQGELYLGNNEFDSAKANYKRTLRLRPDDITARMGYGKSLYSKEQYDSAIIVFDGVNELEPDNAEAKLFRGRTYYYQKRYPEALSEAERLLIDYPDYNEAMLLAGDTHYTQQRYDEALTYYEPVYANGFHTRDLCWIMAWIYDDQKKDVEKAIPFYKEALTYDDTVVEIYTRLSQITKEPEAGEYRKALERLNLRN